MMTVQMNVETEPVIAALQQQLACYQTLARLAQQQHECVRTGQTEQLLQVLAQRQECLDQIGALERRLQEAKANWSGYLARLEPEQRQTAEELLGETRRLLEAIVSGDRDDALILQQQKFNVGQQLGQNQATLKINRRYATAAYGKPAARLDVQR